MANTRHSRYKDGRIDALKRVVLFCGRRLTKLPTMDRKFSAFCDVINYCGAASDRLKRGQQWTKSAPGLMLVSRRRG